MNQQQIIILGNKQMKFKLRIFQTETNLKQTIEQIVQNITIKLKQQETDQFIKELNSPMLAQDSSMTLYQAPIENSSSTQDILGKIVVQEIKKVRAVKQFIFNQFCSNDRFLDKSINSSLNTQQQQIQINNAPNKNRQNNGGSPSKFQNKAFLQEPQLDQKLQNQQLKQLDQFIQNTNQQYFQLQEQIKKQICELQIQQNLQVSNIIIGIIYQKN
ncbi:unnamed protein product [Paramecium pentaurelia]|uniref:Uncharacterized protein n=1 Tax=Paramecium pentaurelia TaxID=43138 RepID=A0A8S1TKH7_9CILI|nr:unnamed protein product [Paramecium pentaurelia]